MTVQEQLQAFYSRRHPRYHGLVNHWRFLEDSYYGGRAWFSANIFRYHKEGDKEFDQRLERAYRFNHTREVVDLVRKYLFKGKVARKDDAAPEELKKFWKNATLNGLSIDQFMSSASTLSSITGRVALVIDNNLAAQTESGARISQRQLKESKFKIYGYIVKNPDILDYAFDEDGDGKLLWIKLREVVRDDRDPLESSGDMIERTRLWTRTESILYEQVVVSEAGARETQTEIQEITRTAHNLNMVPVVLLSHLMESEPYFSPGLIDEIAYLDRAVANYLSNLDAIIQDQTFSQLAIPASAISSGDDMYAKVLELGTKRVFVYDPGAGSTAKPEFLSPDPKQAGVILTVINKIINEIYHSVGLAGERTKEDNSMGIDNSSGVAKAYDFERVNALLLSKAHAAENAENEVVTIVHAWLGQKAPDDDLVAYPETFDVHRLVDELSTAEVLGKLAAPSEVRREQMRQVVDKLFPRLTDDLKKAIEKDIEDWLTGEEVPLTPPTNFAGKSSAAASRQGQVTKDTPAE